MDAIIAAIKTLTLRYMPSLTNDDFLDMNILSVTNRALIYMNRVQLKANYEIALAANNAIPPQVLYDQYGCVVNFADVPVPIPSEVQIVLASTVIQAYKTMTALINAQTGFLQYISDNGQEQRYADKVMSFLTTGSDTDIFAGSTELLKIYRLPNIIENTNYFSSSNGTNLL